MSEQIVAREVAEQEFDRFADMMDLDVDESKMDEEDRTQFRKLKDRILRAMEVGALVVNEDGEPVYTPQRAYKEQPEPITFHERSGASLMAMDRQKKGHDVGRMYAVMGELCKVPPKTFANLKGTDIKVCEALFALLMD